MGGVAVGSALRWSALVLLLVLAAVSLPGATSAGALGGVLVVPDQTAPAVSVQLLDLPDPSTDIVLLRTRWASPATAPPPPPALATALRIGRVRDQRDQGSLTLGRRKRSRSEYVPGSAWWFGHNCGHSQGLPETRDVI